VLDGLGALVGLGGAALDDVDGPRRLVRISPISPAIDAAAC
jgi:hypothetical protein